jgi:hypothetical protein
VQELKILITHGTSYIHENRLFGACCEKEKMLTGTRSDSGHSEDEVPE